MATPETGPSESTFSTPSQRTVVLPRSLPRLRRRWLRFSLRTFLLVLTGLCIWLGVNVNQAQQQKEAVAALERSARRCSTRINVAREIPIFSIHVRSSTCRDGCAISPATTSFSTSHGCTSPTA